MDAQFLMQLMGQYAFPALACIAMAWYVKYITDQNSSRMDKLNVDHKEEMVQVTAALNNNTLALQHLTDMMAYNNNDGK